MWLLLIPVSLAFAWILLPFFGAIMWGTIIALLFSPLFRWMLPRLWHQRSLAALATLWVALVIVVLPVALLTTSVAMEASGVYERIQSGEWKPSSSFQTWFAALPDWMLVTLARLGLVNFEALQHRLDTALAQGIQWVATNSLNIGQNTLGFVVSLFITLYLAFFLIRDGDGIARDLRHAVPLAARHQQVLIDKFTTVIRATVKGSLLVAAIQGTLGGLAFWFLGLGEALLWGVLTGFLSLLPAMGSALVWLPVALYYLVTGAVWQGLGLMAFGALVIGSVDNVLRPILVGRDTRLPEYVIAMATLGGIAVLGLNGLVLGPVIAAMFMAVWHIYVVSRAAVAS
jgi:predicted PurR-regulated permease PerM